MDIKVLCNCGAKFQFEIEPLHGRMPVAIACPACGADATELANVVIASKLAAAPTPLAPPAHVPAPVSAPVESALPTCPKHPGEIPAADCVVCGKPICHRCMQQFGYLCSAYCKGQAQAKKIPVPVFEGQKHEVMASERKGDNKLVLVSVSIAALLASIYLWYWFIGSRPKLAFRIETGPGTPFMHAEWVGSDRFIAVTPMRVAMHNAADGAEIWTADFPKDEIKGSKSKGDDSWYFSVEPRVKVVSKDIWIGLPSRVWRLDAETGKRKQELMLPIRASDYRVASTHFLAVATNPTNESKILTRIDLASGRMDSDATPGVAGAQRIAGVTRAMAGLQNTSLKNFSEKDEEFSDYNFTSYYHDHDYVFTAPNVAHITRKLVEERIATQASTKPQSGPLMIEKQNFRASQGMQAALEMVNSSQPDVKIDESLYSVAIRRYFGGGAEWTGQVTGRPYFFAQKTVDLLVAGKTLIVFDKNNRKLWEAKLTYMTSPEYADSEGEGGPAFELGSRLLFHDQGVLTAYDVKKGEVLWRVNAVGIDGLAPDSAGNLYISATTAGPESIKYTGQIHMTDRTYPQIFKVNLQTGKVLWQSPRVGNNCVVSGDYLFSSDGRISNIDRMHEAAGGDHAQVHWRLYRLNTSNGKDQWEIYRKGAPDTALPSGKRILLHFPTQIRMMKFL